ncbi:MAG: hypothetical protein Q8N63_08595 [Nanoarchaeota archaeon]|nr:hypothetical protein [Nanoarchaeota archaeon]
MEEIVFEKKVSKGSKFNQIYIPKDMGNIVEVGDLVQVRLLEKHKELYYKNQKKLPDFKEYLIKKVLSDLQRFKEIKAIFVVGSFLYETVYNDIDIIIITDEEKKVSEKNIENLLIKNFNQKFHVLLFNEERLRDLIEKDPITRVMLNNYISNKKIDFDYKKKIDKKHILFLLMMPEDLLELKMPSKIFYDNLRRLIAIEEFLRNKDLERGDLLNKIKKEINIKLLDKIKNNEEVNNEEMGILREFIKKKIKDIKKMIKNG